ncbi:MAG: DMT family transporter [Bacteroidales bacterium]|jgi:drug/metabolite transporter (DMT)-like permease|nr:DMT family transporter [Bacteroidales bacterium]
MNIKSKHNTAVFQAILAAALYALSMPFSKMLLQEIPPMITAAFLYLGAGLGMSIVGFIRNKYQKEQTELRLTRNEMPYIIAMVVLDIAAPIFLMFGLTITNAANASLLNNFEIVATAVIALFIFRETISRRLWFAIVLITLSSILLSVENAESFSFSVGSLLVLLACVCWGFENNCTRKISHKDPLQIVVIKGFGSGFGALIIAFAAGEQISSFSYIPAVLLLGFVAYGLSIFFYVYAQREIGAAKTSAYYAIAPFIGVLLSFLILGERPNVLFGIALLIMIIGAWLAGKNK